VWYKLISLFSPNSAVPYRIVSITHRSCCIRHAYHSHQLQSVSSQLYSSLSTSDSASARVPPSLTEWLMNDCDAYRSVTSTNVLRRRSNRLDVCNQHNHTVYNPLTPTVAIHSFNMGIQL